MSDGWKLGIEDFIRGIHERLDVIEDKIIKIQKKIKEIDTKNSDSTKVD